MSQNVVTYKRPPLLKALKRDMQLHFWKYVLILPILVYLALFCYKPMYGLVIAFKNYKPARGIWGSKWVGFNNSTLLLLIISKLSLIRWAHIKFATICTNATIGVVAISVYKVTNRYRFKFDFHTIFFVLEFLHMGQQLLRLSSCINRHQRHHASVLLCDISCVLVCTVVHLWIILNLQYLIRLF